ncbi:DUF4280 domain-containing protein [Flavobacterium sp. ALJ2]|uniref:DUF4280 domain-containing protein n=1 Tax=Flavobacterium sp. ALJ2 TaxID=2786960 RepID=UPI00189F6B15|nr:DUF4280 domain-containing protein [Flavobacterium sp. ALJ2]MBF7092875.1 DUF4280 domain-containing protein [Flavobacterium sp. ALJ2]
MAKYICNGAQCKCTLGTKDGVLDVKSQSKIFIQDKLMATENEKTFLPNFISCNKTNPPTPCQPIINAPWEKTKSNVLQREYKGLLESSTATCSSGGTISILDSKQAETKNVIFGDYSSEPKEISKVYAKVRTLASYKGEFGFDWIDVDPETMEIQKIQDVPFKDVEYFYKKGNSTDDLGNIIAKSADEPGAIQVIQQNYGLINFCDHVDIPFVLLKQKQKITLSVEVFFEGDSQDDYISITGDEFYDFKITGEEERKDENDKTTKKKIIANEKLQLTIKCLKESLNKNYYFLHTGAKGPREIGGLSMMENKVLKLKFRVIALVSNEGNPNEKAKALFRKFKDTKVKEYLNNNSLNQAGYTVEIENFEAMDADDVDDYLYAFDKEEWTKRNLFSKDPNRIRYYEGYNKDGIWDTLSEVQEGQLGDLLEEDGIDNEGNIKYKIKQQNDIDYITIDAYKNKLSTKSKKYDSGGIIILCDLECTDSTIAAYSRIDPIDHYALFVYSSGINTKVNYSHEIGHMLGLKHIFFENNDIEKFKIYKSYVIKLIEDRITIQSESFNYYSINSVMTQKNIIIKALNNYNQSIRKDINRRESKYKQDEKLNGKFSINTIEIINGQAKTITKIISKQEFLNISRVTIDKLEKQEKDNINAIEEFQQKEDIYTLFKKEEKFSLFKEDYISILNDFENYYKELISSNYIGYQAKTTQNIMDYGSDNKRIRFLKHQIKIMRKDYENY